MTNICLPSTSPYISQATWAAAINHLFNGPESEVEATLSRLYSKDCVVRRKGDRLSWAAIYAQVMKIRQQINSIQITSQRWVRNGSLFAEKHTVVAAYKNGKGGMSEVMMMCGLNDDGTAAWLDEMSRTTVTPLFRVQW